MFGEIKLENIYCFLLYDETGLAGDGLVAAIDGEVDAFSPAGKHLTGFAAALCIFFRYAPFARKCCSIQAAGWCDALCFRRQG